VKSGTVPSNITEFNFLRGVRLTGLGFSGHNSVVESRTFPTYITEFYILVGGIPRKEFYGGIRTQLDAIFPAHITEFYVVVGVRLIKWDSPDITLWWNQPTTGTVIFPTYITEFYVLVGVRLMEVGFSGQNSVVESAHNRAPYCHLEGRINCSR
jgi:hypothetical protein